MSTRKKVAIGGAVAVGVAGAAVGAKATYRAGARKGWSEGKRAGIYEGKPLRGRDGKMRPNSEKRDVSRNPYSKGMRPVGRTGRARPAFDAGTKARARRVATARVESNFASGKRRTEGFHMEKRARAGAASARALAGSKVRSRRR